MAHGLGIAEEQKRVGIPSGFGEGIVPQPPKKKKSLLGRLGAGLRKGVEESIGGIADDPLGFLSLAVQNVAASREGRELPSTVLRRERAAQAAFEQKRVEKGAEMVSDALNTAVGIKDPEVRKRFLNTQANLIRQFNPEGAALLEDDEINDDERMQIGTAAIMDPLAQKAFAEGDPATAISLLKDTDRQARLIRRAVFDETPGIMSLLGETLPLALKNAEIDQAEGQKIDLPFFKFQGLQLDLSRKQMAVIGHKPELLENFGINLTDSPFAVSDERGVDSPEAQIALRMIAAGKSIPEGIFTENIEELVKDVTPEEARKALEAGKLGRTALDRPTAVRERALQELDEQEIGVRNVVRETTRLIDLSEADPGLTTSIRGLTTLGGAAAANVDELVKVFEIDTSDLTFKGGVTAEQLKDGGFRDAFEEAFPGIAGENAALQSATFNLAYIRLAARGVSGKSISDKELALTMKGIGASLDDPLAFRDAMKETRRQVIASFKTRFSVINKGEEFTELDKFLEGKGNQFSAFSDEEIQEALNNSSTLTDDEFKDLKKEAKSR